MLFTDYAKCKYTDLKCGTRTGGIISLLKAITLLGSTGSIGTSTLDVVRRWPDRFQVYALVAGENAEHSARADPGVSAESCRRCNNFRAGESNRAAGGFRAFPKWTGRNLQYGPEARVQVATADEVDFVLSAIVGVAGLEATYEAVRHRKTIGLGKQRGSGCQRQTGDGRGARQYGTTLIPVDSEHNGAHQCLRAGLRAGGSEADSDRVGRSISEYRRHQQLASVTPGRL